MKERYFAVGFYTDPSRIYSDALQECRDTFANVYHEKCTPYTLLSWGLSRVIGTEPKKHIPASRWHNALCFVGHSDVENYYLWAKSAFESHLGQLADATDSCQLETYRYQSWHVHLPDLKQETATYIDREIKCIYPAVRRNTKRYKELFASARDKARKSMAQVFAERMKGEHNRLSKDIANDKREADRIRAGIYELEMASTYALKLCPDRADELEETTRKMLDIRLAHASRIENRSVDELKRIQTFLDTTVRCRPDSMWDQVEPKKEVATSEPDRSGLIRREENLL